MVANSVLKTYSLPGYNKGPFEVETVKVTVLMHLLSFYVLRTGRIEVDWHKDIDLHSFFINCSICLHLMMLKIKYIKLLSPCKHIQISDITCNQCNIKVSLCSCCCK